MKSGLTFSLYFNQSLVFLAKLFAKKDTTPVCLFCTVGLFPSFSETQIGEVRNPLSSTTGYCLTIYISLISPLKRMQRSIVGEVDISLWHIID